MGIWRHLSWEWRRFHVYSQDRSATTLLPIILTHILPGTGIISDQRWAYNGTAGIPGAGFQHNTLNHQVHFIDPNTGGNMQRIELSWKAAKNATNITTGHTKACWILTCANVRGVIMLPSETRMFLIQFLPTLYCAFCLRYDARFCICFFFNVSNACFSDCFLLVVVIITYNNENIT